ncbi:hypothetical protein R1flu_008582 [Riccia fluitans]|uniref:Uncharacterized protein n=1 Tax=Riccia fluitans TaxID=41844 RepID=A0ABD1YF82_9MARC
MHTEKAVTKDSLYVLLRPTAGETTPVARVPRVTQPPPKSPTIVHPLESNVQELSSSSAEQPPWKEPRREHQTPPHTIARQEEWATSEDSDNDRPISFQHRNVQQGREDVRSRAPIIRDPARQEPAPRPRLMMASPPRPLQTVWVTTDATNRSGGVRGTGRAPHKDVPLPPVNCSREKNKSVQQDQPKALSAPIERPHEVLPAVCEGDRPDLGPVFESDEQIARMHPEILTLPGMTAAILAPPPAQSATIPATMPGAIATVSGETSEPSLAQYTDQTIALIKNWWLRGQAICIGKFTKISELSYADRQGNGRQAELDALRQQYDLTNLPLHPTSTELMEAMNWRVQFVQTEIDRQNRAVERLNAEVVVLQNNQTVS